jgi:RNA polymerase sigma-70 factor (ECF subfamily)
MEKIQMSLVTTNFGNLSPGSHLELPRERDSNVENTSDLGEFNANWDQCRVSVRAYLSSLISNKSDVEDCVQEVALIAWKKGPSGEGQRAFLGHCLATARLIGLAAVRKHGKSRVQFLPPDVALALADEVTQQELAEPAPVDRVAALRVCLARLDETQRQLLAMRYSDDGRARLDETARGQGKSPDAVYKKLERLRATLRECVSRRMDAASKSL